MSTFDRILPVAEELLGTHRDLVKQLEWLLINRDLNGRVRLIVPESVETDPKQRIQVEGLYQALAERLLPHAFPVDCGILYESSREVACQGAARYPLDGFDQVWMVDRLATEGDWATIAPETEGVPRVVFFSIKGGVGRSTALAALAWSLAQKGKRVLVLDLDLESPGLSSSLLPAERQPAYGIIDWLVEDLVDNADAVFEGMIATSGLSHDGEIYVVPAHGAKPGEYIARLGRVWMPKVSADGAREPWSARLQRLLLKLEARMEPDVVLIDSRAGIDEVASSCVTDLGANLVLLFALEGSQTWSGYRILFEHWQRAGVAEEIRERLQIVAALVPELEQIAYHKNLREHAYEVFLETLYDEIAPSSTDDTDSFVEGWNFDEADEDAPHHPWPVNWHRGFAGLRSLHGRLAVIQSVDIKHIFGPLLDGVMMAVNWDVSHE